MRGISKLHAVHRQSIFPPATATGRCNWYLLAAFVFGCLLLVGCSMGDTAGDAYNFIEASRPEAGSVLQLTGARGSCDVEVEFPKGYSKSKSYPVMVVIQDSWKHPLPDLNRAAAATGYILATPRLFSMDAQEQAGEAKLQSVLDCLALLQARLVADYAADPRRFMLMGRGDDAALVQQVACARSHSIGGLALIDPPAVPVGCRPVHAIPAAVLTSDTSSSPSTLFWVRNNDCDTTPLQQTKGQVLRERYDSSLPAATVQRYTLLEKSSDADPFTTFPAAAWAALEFLARESNR